MTRTKIASPTKFTAAAATTPAAGAALFRAPRLAPTATYMRKMLGIDTALVRR